MKIVTKSPACYVLLITSLVLQGCAATSSLRESAKQLSPDQFGYIAGSFSVNCKDSTSITGAEYCNQGFNSMSIAFSRNDGTGFDRLDSVRGKVLGEDTKYDFTKNQKKGYFFCFPLPVGNYKFYSLSYYNFAGGGSGYSTQNDHRFNLLFSVVSNQITNLGALRML